MTERLEVRYLPLSRLDAWVHNPKRHDLDRIAESIRRHGFKDPVRLEPTLNGGTGGIAEGNGRVETLRRLKAAGEPPPRGVVADGDGEWHVPTVAGVDARTADEASAYAVDHNALVLAGSNLAFEDLLQIWDEAQLKALLSTSPDTAALLVSFDTSELDALLQGPSFDPEAADSQPRLDEKKTVACPACGHEFRP